MMLLTFTITIASIGNNNPSAMKWKEKQLLKLNATVWKKTV